jgi:predicted transcriptional regulator
LLKEPSTKEKVHFQIQRFLLKKSASFMQIVEVCDSPKQTVNKYIDELVKIGNVVLKPKRKQGIEKYALTSKGKKTITLLLEKQKVKTQINQMTSERFEQFKKFLSFIGKSKKGDEFLLMVPDTKFSKKVTKFKNLGTTVESAD